MTYIDEILEEVKAMTPKYGFNVCLFNEDDDPKLTLLKHFNNESEAEEYAEEFEDEIIYIYRGKNVVESQLDLSHQKGHNIDKYLAKAEKEWEQGVNSDNDDYEKLNYGKEVASEGNYDIQPMLTDIANKAIGKEEKEDGLTLKDLLEMTAKELAKKVGKKLGVEVKANEDHWKVKCPECGMDILEFRNGSVQLKEHLRRDHNWSWEDVLKATEGGKGSGKAGHSPWMLGTEISDDCENCQMATNRNNGKCEICGN